MHLLTYSCPIRSTFTKAQLNSVSSIILCAIAIEKRECVNMVKKCLNKEFASDIFDNYFEMIDPSMSSRNNKYCLDYLL